MIIIENNDNDLITTYKDLGDIIGRLNSYRMIIEGDVKYILDITSNMNEYDKYVFLGKRYMELIDKLRLSGFIKI